MRTHLLVLCCVTLNFINSHASDLEQILGSSTNDWRVVRVQGATNDFTVGDLDGARALTAGPGGISITRLKPIAGDAEVTYHVRFTPKDGKSATIYCYAGMKTADDAGNNPLFMQMHIPAAPTADQTSVMCQMPPLPGDASGLYLGYKPYHLPKDRKAWPEMVRLRTEADMASIAPLAKRWIAVRYVFRKNAVQTWVDGRLLRETNTTGMERGDYIRLHVYEGAHLASVRVRELPPENPAFELVDLKHYANATRKDISSLPSKVGGIPFATSKQGEFVDVSRSWMRFGLLEGAFDGWEGETARWRNALTVEPNRLKFRIPNGQYTRIHLLASCDCAPDTTDTVSVQFYRADSGFPVTFSTRVNGKKPHLVTIPIEPEGLSTLSDTPILEFELTKNVRIHRSFPDPIYYSHHGAGLPSGVRVHGITLERASVEADLQPDKFGHIWTAPETPSYTLALRNRTGKDRNVTVELGTTSHDGLEKTSQRRTVSVPSQGESKIKLPILLKRYGHHNVNFSVADGDGTRTQTRSLAFLHPDTRERGGWVEGRGTLWGFWDWGGGHLTPGGVPRLEVMVAAGAESVNRPLVEKQFKPEELAYAASKGMITHYLTYQLTMHKDNLGMEYDPAKPAEMEAALITELKKRPYTTPTALNKPEYAVMFGEPIVGPVSYMSFPEYYGDPPYQMTADEQKNFKKYLDEFLIMARAIKKTWPNAKIAFPWGIPSFPIAFLRHSKEAAELMDGPAVDLILFERLPEMQCHQVTYGSTMWQLKQEWLKTGKKWPTMMSVEGVCTSPATPGALTPQQEADHTIRGALFLAVYNVTQQLGWPTPFRCATSWGETHYGSGMLERMPIHNPKPFYSAYATLTRQLNRVNYVKPIETGSKSVFSLQFKHYKTGELLHVFWTVRGERPVTLQVAKGATVTVYDQMDNDTKLNEKDGSVTLTASTSPCFVWGLKADAKITLGTPDHKDAKPAKDSMVFANLGDGSWKISTDRDDEYENVHLEFIKKFPGKMTTQPVAAPKESGNKALAVHLEKQEKDRGTMPFYTTLVPSKPITIAGKASHLGLWVRAASDWGRFVYCLRDVKGERWISVGKKGEWNVDDVHCWSAFNFDGWRYQRFEMPGNQPWDCYRDMGTSFWGYYGKGDGIVDLPLTLEKIIVERREKVIYLDELKPANPEDVLLADLVAEYERPADKTDEAVRLSGLRMTAGQGGQGGTSVKPKDYNPYR